VLVFFVIISILFYTVTAIGILSSDVADDVEDIKVNDTTIVFVMVI